MTITETDTDLRAEVAELRRALLAIQEELDRRDMEQVALEHQVELLDRRAGTLLYVLGAVVKTLGAVVKTLFGDTAKYNGDAYLDALYDGPRHEAGFRQARVSAWRIPRRRWAQFGSRKELLALAKQQGVKTSASYGREWMIRDLWTAGVLAPFDHLAKDD